MSRLDSRKTNSVWRSFSRISSFSTGNGGLKGPVGVCGGPSSLSKAGNEELKVWKLKLDLVGVCGGFQCVFLWYPVNFGSRLKPVKKHRKIVSSLLA